LTGARAAGSTFTGGLSDAERTSAGLLKLKPAQIAFLNALVQRDVTSAHQGGVTGFASSFSARHTPEERVASGIDGLTEEERSALDALAAKAIAYGPPPSEAFSYSKDPAPVPSEVLVSTPLKPEVHGDVGISVGAGGHGSSFYGTSADLFVTDPSGAFTLGVGISSYHVRGFGGGYGPYCLIPDGPILPGW